MSKLASDVIEVGSLGLIDDPLGIEAGEEAVRRGTAAQLQASRESLEAQRESEAAERELLGEIRGELSPFRTAGAEALPTLRAAIDDPSQRVLSNPFFQALASEQEQRLLQSQAARGKVGAGETGDELTRNLLLLGSEFAQQDITNLQNLTGTGLRAAEAGTTLRPGATQVPGLLTQRGNIEAAGGIAEANVATQATQDLLGGIGTGAGIFAGLS